MTNTRTTVRDLAATFQVSNQTILTHLNAIGKKKKLDKWVPHDLSEDEKLRRMEACIEHLQRNEIEPFMSRIITCDEKWILYDNRKRSAQWLDADEKPKHHPKSQYHPKKVMVTVWWNSNGLINHSFLERGQTITAERYINELQTVYKKLKKEAPSLVNRKGVILLHDNARPHVAKETLLKIRELKFETL